VLPRLADGEAARVQWFEMPPISRYIETVVGGLTLDCLYLPNGNPAPGPKFDYKLAWFERLQKYGKTLIASDAP
jgi:exodeoxyribonuclease-3